MHRYLCIIMLALWVVPLKANDSITTRNKHIHLLISAKPLVKAFLGNDSMQNFFYSRTQFELQYQYRRFVVGFGYNGGHKYSMNYVNGLPIEVNSKTESLSPFASIMAYDQKRWKCFVGAAYIRNYEDRVHQTYSKIETITKSVATIEEGINMFVRVNYSFSKHFSLEMEGAFYSTKARTEHEEDYPLTPSMNSFKSYYNNYRTYAIPANLYLKCSF
jgi:hypothetical protein